MATYPIEDTIKNSGVYSRKRALLSTIKTMTKEERISELIKKLTAYQREKKDSLENVKTNIRIFLIATKQEAEITKQLKNLL